MSTETHTSGDRGQQEARAEWSDARERADRLVAIFRNPGITWHDIPDQIGNFGPLLSRVDRHFIARHISDKLSSAELVHDRPIATEAPVRLQGDVTGSVTPEGLEVVSTGGGFFEVVRRAPEPVAEEMGLIVGSPGYYRVRVRLGGQCLFTGDFYHMIDAEDACDAINAALRSPATEEAP